ncbi:hypothetical protein MXB_3412, partial [Myxobolus squamalis]
NTDGAYSPTLFTDVATDIIYQSAKTPDQPFFLFLSLQLPQFTNGDLNNTVPKNWLEYFDGVYDDLDKKTHAAMVMALDVSLGRVMDALALSSILDRSAILFLSESTSNVCSSETSGGCNFPLRGGRGTLWEGGIRSSAIFYSSIIKTQGIFMFVKPQGQVIDDMIHVTDWLPTLASLAQIDASKISNINGVTILPTLIDKKTTKRTYIFHNFDTFEGEVAALRVHEYKLIIGEKLGSTSAWNRERIITKNQTDALIQPGFRPDVEMKKNYSSIVLCNSGYPHPLLNIHAPPCKPTLEPCLFNLIWDPCEYHNLASFMDRTVDFMMSKLGEIKKFNNVKRPNFPSSSKNADPALYGGNWHWWLDDIIWEGNSTLNSSNSPILSNINALNTAYNIDNKTKITLGIDDYNPPMDSLSNNQFHLNQTNNDKTENELPNPSQRLLIGTLEHSANGTSLNSSEEIDIQSKENDETEKLWNNQHDTLNLNHYLEFKNIKNKTKKVKTNFSSNSSLILTNNISAIENFTFKNNYNSSNESKLPIENNTRSKSDLSENSEILEIYDTPTNSVGEGIAQLNFSDLKMNGSSDLIFESGTKREKLPDNILEYKEATSRGKTTIKMANDSLESAYLKTKAIAGGQYDEKSNMYDGSSKITSLDDEKLKIWSGSETMTKLYPLNQNKQEQNLNPELINTNSSVEELFIDWDLLSKQSSFVTGESVTEKEKPVLVTPKNLVTSEPLEQKSSLFIPYNQDYALKDKSDVVLFQRTIKEKPESSSYNEKNSNEFHDNQIKLVFDNQDSGKPLPFHGSLSLGPQRVYEFQGTAKDVGNGESVSVTPIQNKFAYLSNSDDSNHFYGISLLQPNNLQPTANKTEITESEANLKLVKNISASKNQESLNRDSKIIFLEKNLLVNNKSNTLEKPENQTVKSRVLKSDIPNIGIIGDESDSPQISDDIFKMLSDISNKTVDTQNKDETIKEFSSNTVTIKNIEQPSMPITTKIPVVENLSYAANTSFTPLSILSLINDTKGEKKGYPFSRPNSSPSSGATVVSTIVAVVLSAFVIIGMAVIAIVAIVAKNFGSYPSKNTEETSSSLKKPSPSGSYRSSKDGSPKRPRRLNR